MDIIMLLDPNSSGDQPSDEEGSNRKFNNLFDKEKKQPTNETEETNISIGQSQDSSERSTPRENTPNYPILPPLNVNIPQHIHIQHQNYSNYKRPSSSPETSPTTSEYLPFISGHVPPTTNTQQINQRSSSPNISPRNSTFYLNQPPQPSRIQNSTNQQNSYKKIKSEWIPSPTHPEPSSPSQKHQQFHLPTQNNQNIQPHSYILKQSPTTLFQQPFFQNRNNYLGYSPLDIENNRIPFNFINNNNNFNNNNIINSNNNNNNINMLPKRQSKITNNISRSKSTTARNHNTQSNLRYYCQHVGCSFSYSHSSGRSNHYNTFHTKKCTTECDQCKAVDKKQSTKKVRCRHEVSCDKVLSTSNRASHEKNLKMHTKCSPNCNKCQEIKENINNRKQSENQQNNNNQFDSNNNNYNYNNFNNNNLNSSNDSITYSDTDSDEYPTTTTTTTTTSYNRYKRNNEN